METSLADGLIRDFPSILKYRQHLLVKRGWEPLIRRMCEKLVAAGATGTLRCWTYHGGLFLDGVEGQGVAEIGQEAIEAAARTCEACGDPGELQVRVQEKKRYTAKYSVRCPEHTNEQGKKALYGEQRRPGRKRAWIMDENDPNFPWPPKDGSLKLEYPEHVAWKWPGLAGKGTKRPGYVPRFPEVEEWWKKERRRRWRTPYHQRKDGGE